MAYEVLGDLFGPGAPSGPLQVPARAHPSLNPISAVGGFLGNVLGGAAGVVTGTTGIFSGVGSDIIKLATGDTHDLFTPHFLATAPGGIASDYARRYGSLGGLAHGLYNDPLSYAFDVLGAGALAGKAGEVAAAAGKEGPLIDALTPKTRNIFQHPQAQEFGAEGPNISQIVDHRNPVTRFLVNNTFNRRRIVPVSNLQQQVEYWKEFEKTAPLDSAEKSLMQRYEAVLKKAGDTGITIMQNPKYAEARVGKLALKLRSQFMAHFAADRRSIEQGLNYDLAPLKNYSADEIGRYDRTTMGLDDQGIHHFNPDELIPQLQRKNFTDFADAQDAVARDAAMPGSDPRVAGLHYDELAAIRRSIPTPLEGTAVVDASGAPLRVFHGTSKAFEKFDPAVADPMAAFGPGVYATDSPKVASSYAGDITPMPPDAAAAFPDVAAAQLLVAPQVRPFYLDIKNPFRADGPVAPEIQSAIASAAEQAGHPALAKSIRTGGFELAREAELKAGAAAVPPSTALYQRIARYFDGNKQQANELLQSAGFDGIEYRGGLRTKGTEHRAFVAFDTAQVHPFLPNPNPGYIRSMRPVAVQNLSMGQAVQASFPSVPELLGQARTELGPFQDGLRELYGQGVAVSMKSLDRSLEKAAVDQALPTDALRARVTVADAKDAPGELQKLGRKFQIEAVVDTRGRATTWGQRSLAATVRLPSGMAAEVEFVTPRAAAIRDANATTEHLLEGYRNEAAKIEREMANPELSPENATTLMKRGAIVSKQIDYTEKQLQANWEQVADELDAQLNGKAMPGGGKREAFNRLRTRVWANETKPLIDAGVFDPARAFESAYLPLRQESGAHWDAAAQDFIDGKTADELHAERMAQDLPMPIYYPQISIDERGMNGYLSGRSLKPGTVKRLMTPNFLKARSGKLFLDDTYIRDVKDAHMRRSIEALRHRDTLDFIKNIINRFGRPIEDAAEVGKDEALIAPMGFLNFYNAKLTLTDKMLESLAEGLGAGKGELTLDQVQAIVEDAMPGIQRNTIAVTKRGVQLYAVPKVVRDMVEGGAGLPSGFENKVRVFWDTPNKVWRSLVLTGRPAWLTNNTLGSALFLAMQPGAKILTAFRQLDEPFMHALGQKNYVGFRTAAREVIPAELQAQVTTGLFTAEAPSAMPHLGSATPKEGSFLDAVNRKWHSNRVITRLHNFGQRMQFINSQIEDINRTASFVGEAEMQAIKAGVLKGTRRFWSSKEDLRMLARKGMSPENAQAALDKVNYFHHDYNALTPIERNYVRRFAAPFYNFYKHVFQLALHYPFDYAGRMAVAADFTRFDQEMQNDKLGALPPWLQGAVPLGPVGPAGVAFFSGANANPFQAVLPTTQFSFLNLAYPELKVLVEQATGRSALTGRAFSDANVIVPFGTEIGYRIDNKGNVIGPEPTTTPGVLEHLLQQVPEYTLVKDIAAGGRPYDTETLPSIISTRLTGGEPRAVGYTGEPLPLASAQMVGRFLGVPTYSFNPQSYQAGLQKGATDALSLWRKLQSQGEGGTAPGPTVAPPMVSGYTGLGNLFG